LNRRISPLRIVSTINLMMDTMDTEQKRVRRNHSAALKAQVLAECAAPGASVAKVAMSHGINANIVHGWRRTARERAARLVVATPTFVPLAIEAAPQVERNIEVEVRRGAMSMTIAWPISAAAEMTAWMRELLR
jgi:transposase